MSVNIIPDIRRRIIAGMGANTFGMGVSIAIQLASLPLFLHFWNLESYGKWLILSAIPAYLSFADVGMVTAAGNKMTMAIGKKDVIEANQIFQTTQVFMGVFCGLLAFTLLPVILFDPLQWFENMDQRISLSAMALGVLISLFGGLSEAAFKATERYALGTMLGSYSRIGEWLGCILGLALIGSFASVAIGGLVMRILGSLVSMSLVNKHNSDLKWGVTYANYVELKSMFKPAVLFMAFPLANAFNFQSITILVGAMFGPVSVALFSTYRTIARVAVQITAIFSHALWPEFSRLFGQGTNNTVRVLFLRSSFLSALQTLLLSILLFFVSPWLLKIWTHNSINFDSQLMLCMLIYAAVCGVWHVPRILLMATNQHSNLAYWTLIVGLISFGFSWLFGHFIGLLGVIVAMVLSEFLIAIVCSYLANSLTLNK